MSDAAPGKETSSVGPAVADDGEVSGAERRRRRARVFGEVLPATTADERGHESGDGEGDTDDWLRRQVPPHHG